MEQEDRNWGGKREGTGRKSMPAGQKRVNLVVKIKPAIASELRRIAKENHVSVSSIVENIVENNL